MALGLAPASAQEVSDGPLTLDTIVVTTTAGERFLKDAPASVSVIGGDELRNRPVRNLTDAIEGMPGTQTSGLGLGHRGVSIRGMLPDQTLYLVDGMRISNSASAIAHSDYELNWIPPEAIDRVEVVRGPMSSLYGSEALGGVVNVITRDATDKWKGSVSTYGLLTEHGLGGNGSSFGGYAGGPLVPGVLGLNLWGQYTGRSNLESPDDRRVSSLGSEKAFVGNASLTWTPDARQRIDIFYGGGFERRWSDLKGSGHFPAFYRSNDRVWRQRFGVTHNGTWDWGASQVRLYGSTLKRENERSDGGASSGPQNFVDLTGDGHLSFSPIDNHKITIGGEIRKERLKDPTINHQGRASQLHYAGFVQDEIYLSDKFELVLGGRVDHHEAFGWNASPRAYVLYHFNDGLTFKGGVGTGFKAPTLKQLSPEYQAVAGGGRFTIIGNPDLEPEKNVSFEGGFEYQEGIWSARAMAFQNDVKNLIQTVCILRCSGAPGSTRTYENVDRARIRGIELGGGVEISSSLRLDANYTYLDPKDRKTDELLTGRSQHAANATVTWLPFDRMTTSFRVNYLGPQKTSTGSGRQPGYTLYSAYANYELREQMTLQLGIENISDVRLADDSSDYAFADSGRRYFIGLQAKF